MNCKLSQKTSEPANYCLNQLHVLKLLGCLQLVVEF